jgi:hypothetical protein
MATSPSAAKKVSTKVCSASTWTLFLSGLSHLRRLTRPAPHVNHTFDHEYEYTKDEDSTGWAWWAGTSFATPIITGLLARTRAQHLNGQNNRTKDEDKLKSLSRNGGQVAPEKVIYAKQG